jgi:hypothetical protein
MRTHRLDQRTGHNATVGKFVTGTGMFEILVDLFLSD